MPKKILLILIFIAPILGLAQTVTIKGTVKDTVNYTPMAFSSISLIGTADSIIYHKQFTDNNGDFSFNKVKNGKYVLLITRPTFADYEEILTVNNTDINLGAINLLLKENLLQELIIKDIANAIRIKGDTTEFLADSFYTNKNANVEDLLKRLPGLQVDKTGKITAQGETVKRVLVDGEEFFGDDPTIATRNLKAENIKTVQVFDSKSEQALLTGVDDGQKEKTINLTLKDEAKKGYFGKVRSAYGPGEDKIKGIAENKTRYENEAMLNVFNAKRKLSVFGTLTNTNQTGLNWSDAGKYAGGNGETTVDEESGSVTTTYITSDNEMLARTGVPRTGYLGTFYANKFNDGKQNVSGTANYKNFLVNGFDNNYTKYILPDTVYFNNQEKTFKLNKELYTAKGKLDFKLDSTSSLRFNFNVNKTFGRLNSDFNTFNLNGLEQLVNKNVRSDSSTDDAQSLSLNALYFKKFKTKGRSFSAQISQDLSQSEVNGFYYSKTTFFGVSDSISEFNQKRINLTNNVNFTARLTYTEPLAKDWFLVTNYMLTSKLNTTTNTTQAKNGADYSIFVDSLSNKFDYNILTNQGGITFKHSQKKISYSFGGQVAYTDLVQKNLILNTTQNQPFYNFFPAANFNYNIRNTSNLNINYNGSTRQPTLQQIQPLQNISNPLVIYKGNPNLVQSFTNRINIGYNSYAPIKGRGVYAHLNFSMVNNDFANYDKVDNLGRREYQTINVNGNYHVNSYAYYYIELKKYHIDLNFNLSGNIGKDNNFINGLANSNNNANISLGFNINYDLEEVFEIDFGIDYDYNYSVSSLRKDIPTQFNIVTYSSEVEIFLPAGFILSPRLNYSVRQKTVDFNTNLNVALLNAKLSKKILKNKSLEFSIFAYDILNQNIGFNRNAYSNFVNQQTYSVLQRYVLFGLTYNLSGGGAKKVKSEEDDYE